MNHFIRHRRTRKNVIIRNLVSENYILPSQLILPIFIKDGINIKERIESFSDIFRYSVNKIIEVIDRALLVGVKTFALFPCVEKNLKTPQAEESYNPDNLICRTIIKLKKKYKDEIVLMTDVALDPYTTH